MNEQVNDTPLDRNDPDVLISRIVDSEATPADWAAFHALAEQDGSLWRELAEAQRTQAELGEEVGVALATASLVDAPVHAEIERRFNQRIRMVGMWGGWLAAACVGVMWVNNAPQVQKNPGNSAGFENPLQAYLDRGKADGTVLEERPEKLLVSTAPATDSGGNVIGVSVVYVRQIVERAVVKDLYRYGQDDAGRAIPIKFEVRSGGGGKGM